MAKQIHKLQKVLYFKHIQFTCDQLVSTCVDWPNSEKLASTCTQSELNSSQFITSGWPKETQVECKLKTCVDLQVCLARDLA